MYITDKMKTKVAKAFLEHDKEVSKNSRIITARSPDTPIVLMWGYDSEEGVLRCFAGDTYLTPQSAIPEGDIDILDIEHLANGE